MEFAYSPSQDAGGTLHLSPTHLHHGESPMARTLRRSMSRSPSRSNLNCHSTPPRSSFHNTPKTSSRTNTPQEIPNDDFQMPSAKKARPTLRRTSPLSSISQSSRPSRSAMQRALSDTSDNGNATPRSSSGNSADGQENLFPSSPESAADAVNANPPADSPPKTKTPTKALRLVTRAPIFRPSKQEWRPVKSSPLKRSDAVMNFALNPPGSPSAKRRTICGGVVSSPFGKMRSIWDQNQSDRDLTSSDEEIPSHDAPFHSSLAPEPLPARRPKSLVRHPEKLSLSGRRGLDPARTNTRGRTHAQPNTTSHSSESDDNGTIHDANDVPRVQFARPMRAQPHPLSQALSPTSPTPAGRDESFGRAGPLFNSPAVPPLDFSRSLPIGALRPNEQDVEVAQGESQQSFESSFATPKFYHIAKPDPTAFRSTGLISKKHRNADDIPPPPDGHPDMPDTPCKRFPGTFTFSTSPSPANSVAKDQRFSKPAFGTASKPFNPHGSRSSSGSLGNSGDIFGSNFKNAHSPQRANVTGFEADEATQSPQCHTESQSSADELPPTPTKQVLGNSNTKPNSLRSSLLGRRPSLGPATFTAPESADSQQSSQAESSCKSLSLLSEAKSDKYDPARSGLPAVPTVPACNALQATPVKLVGVRLLRKHPRRAAAASSPLTKAPCKKKQVFSNNSSTAKKSSSVFQQPHPISSAERGVPHTPVDNALPDPSGLSISPGWKHTGSAIPAANYSKAGSFPPATPTHRDGIAPLNFCRPIATPSNHVLGHDVDPVLSQRFKKVEWYSKGQFSEVYKVFEPRESVSAQSFFALCGGSRSSQTPMPDQVYIVKKSKMPYTSMKIRQRKLREAAVMSALGKSDHIVHLVNSWEASGHLYIQTEFCEEGSLEQFLAKAGNKGRLDDFRIWKILIELSEGLKQIHHSGFIHLDLKPANVFIDFAGVLKIGDFGLASEWPAPANVEGEGDRRYIGPDLLQGAFDKPADIFALGMMMFEIAGNCELPDNGTYWQHLRSGNWSDLPSLTSASSYSSFRDDSTDDLVTSGSLQNFGRLKSLDSLYPTSTSVPSSWQESCGTYSQSQAVEDMTQPPTFMQDPQDPEALEQIVHWMMQPNPADRPVVDQILEVGGCRWVDERRRAGAVVFEGPWGPPSHVLAPHGPDHEDEEMLDAP